MNFHKIYLAGLFSLVLSTTIAQKSARLSAKELAVYIGCWNGTLNYSGTVIRKPYKTTAALAIKQIGKSNSFQFLHMYTKDAADNKADTFLISTDGKQLSGAIIKSKKQLKNGILQVITEANDIDHDNNKSCTTRRTYLFQKKAYIYKKEVQLEGEAEWLEREHFTYVRMLCDVAKRNIRR